MDRVLIIVRAFVSSKEEISTIINPASSIKDITNPVRLFSRIIHLKMKRNVFTIIALVSVKAHL